MKKLLSVVLAMTLFLCVVPLGAMSVSAANVSHLSYSISENYVVITGCDPNASGNLYIPETIEGYPVTRINPEVFKNCDKLLKVVIPDSVTSMGYSVFEHCDNLTSVVIGNGIKTIPIQAFAECVNLTSVTMGNKVTHIKTDAFSGCVSLETLALPNSVVRIWYGAFSGCTSLVSMVIPDSVTDMEDTVFTGCSSLTSIALPQSIQTFGSCMFADCSSLTEVTIPDGVTLIGYRTFFKCYNLTSIVIPKSVTAIEEDAFKFCDNLTDIYYEGSEKDWNKISVGERNADLLNATVHFAEETEEYVSVYSPDVTHSVMDTEKGNGLAFRFELTAKGIYATADAKAVLTNATVNQLGTDCKLVAMGAVLTNDVLIGENEDYLTLDGVDDHTVINISAVYLQEVDEDGCAFATRIINIPTTHLERTIYARPYCTIEVDSEQVTVYGDIDSASCAEYM